VISPSVREASVAEGLMMGMGMLRRASAVSSAVELLEGPTRPATHTEMINKDMYLNDTSKTERKELTYYKPNTILKWQSQKILIMKLWIFL
jgi:hypothetical protein